MGICGRRLLTLLGVVPAQKRRGDRLLTLSREAGCRSSAHPFAFGESSTCVLPPPPPNSAKTLNEKDEILLGLFPGTRVLGSERLRVAGGGGSFRIAREARAEA